MVDQSSAKSEPAAVHKTMENHEPDHPKHHQLAKLQQSSFGNQIEVVGKQIKAGLARVTG